MGKFRILFARTWRKPRVMTILFLLEFPLTVAMLTLFGVADPNTYRSKLRQNGADQGFNSDEQSAIYAYANYKPVDTPMIWSQYMTDFNVVVSVLSMFLLLAKVTIYVMHWLIPFLSLIVHGALIALYAYAIRNQASSDMSDPKRPSPGLAWYLSKGCGYATQKNWSYCMQARASFGLSIVMLALFTAYFVWAVVNLIPSADEKKQRLQDYEMRQLEKYEPDALSQEEQRQYNRALFLNIPKTPTTPFHMANNPMTPRTKAFTQLNGGKEPEKGPVVTVTSVSNAGPSRQLPFREHYEKTG